MQQGVDALLRLPAVVSASRVDKKTTGQEDNRFSHDPVALVLQAILCCRKIRE